MLGITTGDPAGIGPEVSLRAAADAGLRRLCGMVLFGDARLLESRSADLAIPFDYPVLEPRTLEGAGDLPRFAVVDLPVSGEIEVGRGSAASGEAAARNITACARACMSRRLSAMVTAPLSKRFLQEAGYPYPGHTEFLAELAGANSVAMAFVSDRLKVVLVTIHLPLRVALARLSAESIAATVGIALREFPRLGLPCRRIAVAAVNPHAGESGLLGDEEREVIEPALRRSRHEHPEAQIEGPVPADTVFYRAAQGEFDLVVALFHDQGLQPVKLLGFGEAVNVTLGLPFVRTSVDHGTAFDIAGRGVARSDSMRAAVRWAVRLNFRDA
jgi:4-hydroxythreonine-4-phosphate dehydrogenase